MRSISPALSPSGLLSSEKHTLNAVKEKRRRKEEGEGGGGGEEVKVNRW